jgi:preprotein translocase subunit SecF
MKFFELVPKTNIDFLRQSRICASVSAVLVAASVILWALWGFNLSIDFLGGTVLEIAIPDRDAAVDIAAVRSALAEEFENVSVVTLDSAEERSYAITLRVSEEEVATDAAAAIPAPGAGAATSAVRSRGEDDGAQRTLGQQLVQQLERKLGTQVEVRRLESVGPLVQDDD